MEHLADGLGLDELAASGEHGNGDQLRDIESRCPDGPVDLLGHLGIDVAVDLEMDNSIP